MVGMIGGATLGALVGLLAAICFFVDGRLRIGLMVIVVLAVLGGAIGLYVECESSSKFVESYSVAKTTIESSLTAEDLSGFERMELVRNATELNQELAEAKYTASKWYGIATDDRVLDLEYILND